MTKLIQAAGRLTCHQTNVRSASPVRELTNKLWSEVQSDPRIPSRHQLVDFSIISSPTKSSFSISREVERLLRVDLANSSKNRVGNVASDGMKPSRVRMTEYDGRLRFREGVRSRLR
jgi:hypothetical protein